jgi:hypothetical protein
VAETGNNEATKNKHHKFKKNKGGVRFKNGGTCKTSGKKRKASDDTSLDRYYKPAEWRKLLREKQLKVFDLCKTSRVVSKVGADSDDSSEPEEKKSPQTRRNQPDSQ